MFESLHVTSHCSDITAGRVMVQEHAACTENLIPTFKPFDLVQNGWSKATDIVSQVGEDMELGLNNDAVRVN